MTSVVTGAAAAVTVLAMADVVKKIIVAALLCKYFQSIHNL